MFDTAPCRFCRHDSGRAVYHAIEEFSGGLVNIGQGNVSVFWCPFTWQSYLENPSSIFHQMLEDPLAKSYQDLSRDDDLLSTAQALRDMMVIGATDEATLLDALKHLDAAVLTVCKKARMVNGNYRR